MLGNGQNGMSLYLCLIEKKKIDSLLSSISKRICLVFKTNNIQTILGRGLPLSELAHEHLLELSDILEHPSSTTEPVKSLFVCCQFNILNDSWKLKDIVFLEYWKFKEVKVNAEVFTWKTSSPNFFCIFDWIPMSRICHTK